MKKQCSRCGETKSEEEYHKDRRTKDGLYSSCRKCHYLYRKGKKDWQEKDWEKHRKRHSAYQRKWRIKNKERVNAYKKKWYEKNKEQYKKYRREYEAEYRKKKGENHKAYMRKYMLEWLKTPKGKQSDAKRNYKRRTQFENVICDLSLDDWQEILKEQNDKCNMCELQFTEENKPTQDHIYPISKGGHHTKSNIQALCLLCNIAKSDKILLKDNKLTNEK